MTKLDYALITDGASDGSLLPLIKWILRKALGQIPLNGLWADLTRFDPPLRTLAQRINKTIEHYQPDLIFVHRDAEAQEPQLRYEEIKAAISEIKIFQPEILVPHICVVPVHMTEAWLLFDEKAIRKAAGNPNGQIVLELPPLNNLEAIGDPKKMLFNILIKASELRGRHRKRFNPAKCRLLIAENINDFSPLFNLSAFNQLYMDIKQYAKSLAE
jgi:hypothetical protein